MAVSNIATTPVIYFIDNKITRLQFRVFSNFFFLSCRLNLTPLNLVIYILNKILSICRVLFTVRILQPCFILKWESVSAYLSFKWFINHLRSIYITQIASYFKRMAHLSSQDEGKRGFS